jgi:hypothetical protein
VGFLRSYAKLMNRCAHGRTVLILLLTAMAVYCYMVFVSIPAVMSYEGKLRLLDMKPLGYDLEYVRLLFLSLGTEGRQAYLSQQLPIDMIYPLLFALSGGMLLAYLFNKGLPTRPGLALFSLIPIVAGLCDYGENFGIIAMLRSFPELSPTTVQLTAVFTVLKSGLTTVFWLVMLVGVIIVLTRKRGVVQPT